MDNKILENLNEVTENLSTAKEYILSSLNIIRNNLLFDDKGVKEEELLSVESNIDDQLTIIENEIISKLNS